MPRSSCASRSPAPRGSGAATACGRRRRPSITDPGALARPPVVRGPHADRRSRRSAIAVTVWSVALGLLTSPIWFWALPDDGDDTIPLLDEHRPRLRRPARADRPGARAARDRDLPRPALTPGAAPPRSPSATRLDSGAWTSASRITCAIRAAVACVAAGAHDGAAGGAACGDLVRISLRVEGERVAQATFDASGCGAALAAASAAVELLDGAHVLDAARIGAPRHRRRAGRPEPRQAPRGRPRVRRAAPRARRGGPRRRRRPAAEPTACSSR